MADKVPIDPRAGEQGMMRNAVKAIAGNKPIPAATQAHLEARRPPTPPTSARSAMDQSNMARVSELARPGSYKRGGIVRQTGMALIHKGERVLTKRQNSRAGRRSGGR